jgi:hypothetical protein
VNNKRENEDKDEEKCCKRECCKGKAKSEQIVELNDRML